MGMFEEANWTRFFHSMSYILDRQAGQNWRLTRGVDSERSAMRVAARHEEGQGCVGLVFLDSDRFREKKWQCVERIVKKSQ